MYLSLKKLYKSYHIFYSEVLKINILYPYYTHATLSPFSYFYAEFLKHNFHERYCIIPIYMLTVLYAYCILLTVPSIFTFFKCLLLFFLNNVLVSYPTKRKRAYRLHSLLYHIICRDCNYSLYCIICFTKCIFF